MVQPRLRQPTNAELCEYGGISIPYLLIAQRTHPQNANAIRQGPEGQRADQQGSIKFKIGDFSGGLFKRVGDWTRDGNRYAYNEGLMTHIPGGLYLPYVLTTQTSITSDVDISGYRAANLRVRAVNTALGTTALRYYLAFGTKLYYDTSASDPTILLAHTLTDNITAMAVSKQNNVTYLILGTDGSTNDVSGIADPADAPTSLTTLIAYTAGTDWTGAIGSFATVGDGFTLYYMKYNGTTGLWYVPFDGAVPFTPLAVVNSPTRIVANASNTSVTTAAHTAGSVFTTDGTTGLDQTWSTGPTATNLGTSDDSRAVFFMTNVATSVPVVYLTGFGFNIPTGSSIQGIVVSAECSIDNVTSFDADFADAGAALGGGAELMLAGVPNTVYRKTNGTNFTASDVALTFGGSADKWIPALTVDDVNDEGFGVKLLMAVNSSTANDRNARIDHVTITITYIPPGAQVTLPIGGWSPGPLPSNPTRWPLVLPTVDEEATVLTPRELWYMDVSHAVDGDWPVATLSKVNTGLSHVEAAVPHLGGLAVAGDTSSGIGKQVKLIDSSGNVRDLGFLSQDGYPSAVGVVNLFSAGRVLIAEVALESAADTQWWYYFDGTWHSSTPLQSKSAAIAALPLAWAETAININQQYRYRIFPNSTDTAVAREFQPRNIFEDPLVNNTAIVKQNGPLFLRTPELNVAGPEEANKAIVRMDYLGRLVDDDTSYGSTRVELDTGGDTTVASAEVDNTFNTAFESYNVPSSGVAFRTIIAKVTLDNQATSTETPNGVPLLFTCAVEWPHLSVWDVFLDVDELMGRYDHITNFYDELVALANTKVTQRFRWGTVDVPAVFSGMDFQVFPVPLGSGAVELQGKPFVTFRQTLGTVS